MVRYAPQTTWEGIRSQERAFDQLMVDNAKVWQQAWEKTVGKNRVLRTDPRFDSMVKHLGYESQAVQYGMRDALSRVIKTDALLVLEMADRLSEAEVLLDKELTPQQLIHLNLARAIARDYEDIGSVKAAIIPPASEMVGRTAGLYEFETALIKIHADMLNSANDTVGVMVHELGHHVAYRRTSSKEKASDLIPDHTAAMEYVAGRIFRAVSEGKYDEYLKKAIW